MGTLWGVDWVAVEAIATVVTAVILLATLLFAAGQVAQARRLREDQTRPYVVVDIEPSRTHPFADLYVVNLGATAAHDVTFTFSPALRTTQEDKGFVLRDTVLVRDGIFRRCRRAVSCGRSSTRSPTASRPTCR